MCVVPIKSPVVVKAKVSALPSHKYSGRELGLWDTYFKSPCIDTLAFSCSVKGLLSLLADIIMKQIWP